MFAPRSVFVFGLLLALCACTKPPVVDTSAEWVVGECAQLSVKIVVNTEPKAEVTLLAKRGADRKVIADEKGVVTFVLPQEELESFRVRVNNGEVTVTHVASPPPRIMTRVLPHHKNKDGPPHFANSCGTAAGRRYACSVSLDKGGVTLGGGAGYGSTISLAGKEATSLEGKGFPSVPVPFDIVKTWDLSVFSSESKCPHVTIPGVQVKVKGTVYVGDVWASRLTADWSIAHAFGESLAGKPWSQPATGNSALVLSRHSEKAPHGFVRWDGDPKILSDIKYLVRETSLRKTLGSCGMYRKDRSSEKVEVFDKRRDLKIEIFERATGKLLGDTHIRGKRAGCTSIVFSRVRIPKNPRKRADIWIGKQLRKLRRQ